MEVSLSPEAQAELDHQLKLGWFESPSDVITHALLMMRIDRAPPEFWESLRKDVEEARKDVEAGRGRYADAAYFEEMREAIRKQGATA